MSKKPLAIKMNKLVLPAFTKYLDAVVLPNRLFDIATVIAFPSSSDSELWNIQTKLTLHLNHSQETCRYSLTNISFIK